MTQDESDDMNRIRIITLTAAAITAVAMVGVSTGGAQAVARHLIGSKQIKDHSVRVVDLSPSTIKSLKGHNGKAGVNGKAGLNGTAGKDGTNGVDGKDGLDGTNGTDGADGDTGGTGASAFDLWSLLEGNDGLTLADFFASLVGAPGSNGHNGADGVNGNDGANGSNGHDGIDGSQGEHGVDGVNGLDGAPGQVGENGKDGAPGQDGKDGVNGKDGAPGQQGERGLQGAPGQDGKDGKDAAPLSQHTICVVTNGGGNNPHLAMDAACAGKADALVIYTPAA